MRRRKKDLGGGGGDSWLNTYADMVTLLLTFFVMLFSMSSIDAEKWKILVEAFGAKGEANQIVFVPVEYGNDLVSDSGDSLSFPDEVPGDIELLDFNTLYLYIKQYVEQHDLESEVTVNKGENSVFIRFEDSVFFNPDKADLRSDALPLLKFLGDCFLAVEDEILSIRINGHTATVPGTIKKPGFDRTLSTERANSVLLYFEDEIGFDPKKLIAIGYGRNYPVASNDNEDGRKKNRRVEIMILSNEFDISEESDLFRYMSGQLDVDLFDDDQNREEILIPDNSGGEGGSKSPTNSGQTSKTSDTSTTADGRTIHKDVSPYDDNTIEGNGG
ncbi:MAG: flagellar motor protein MotB [Eubacteriales bacterium]